MARDGWVMGGRTESHWLNWIESYRVLLERFRTGGTRLIDLLIGGMNTQMGCKRCTIFHARYLSYDSASSNIYQNQRHIKIRVSGSENEI